MRTEIDLNECEIDLNECEIYLNGCEIYLNECEIYLNERKHVLKANLDRSQYELSLQDRVLLRPTLTDLHCRCQSLNRGV